MGGKQMITARIEVGLGVGGWFWCLICLREKTTAFSATAYKGKSGAVRAAQKWAAKHGFVVVK